MWIFDSNLSHRTQLPVLTLIIIKKTVLPILVGTILFTGCDQSHETPSSKLPSYGGHSIDAWFYPEFSRMEELLNSPPEDPQKRYNAFRSMGQVGVDYLVDRLKGKPLERIEKQWQKMFGQHALADKQNKIRIRHQAALVLGEMGELAASAIPTLEATARSEGWLLQGGAKTALIKIRKESIDPLLKELEATIGHDKWNRTAMMVGDLGLRAETAIPILLKALKHPEGDAQGALTALMNIGLQPDKCIPAIVPFLEDRSAGIRQIAITALWKYGEKSSIVKPEIKKATKDKDPVVSDRAKSGGPGSSATRLPD
jgi:hypothetical protein